MQTEFAGRRPKVDVTLRASLIRSPLGGPSGNRLPG